MLSSFSPFGSASTGTSGFSSSVVGFLLSSAAPLAADKTLSRVRPPTENERQTYYDYHSAERLLEGSCPAGDRSLQHLWQRARSQDACAKRCSSESCCVSAILAGIAATWMVLAYLTHARSVNLRIQYDWKSNSSSNISAKICSIVTSAVSIYPKQSRGIAPSLLDDTSSMPSQAFPAFYTNLLLPTRTICTASPSGPPAVTPPHPS